MTCPHNDRKTSTAAERTEEDPPIKVFPPLIISLTPFDGRLIALSKEMSSTLVNSKSGKCSTYYADPLFISLCIDYSISCLLVNGWM